MIHHGQGREVLMAIWKKVRFNKGKKDKEAQKDMCGIIDKGIGGGSSLTPEVEFIFYNNEENYSKIVRNYTHYTNAIVWMNFAFKLVYFIGSCVVLYVITSVLLDVVYFAINEQEPSGFWDILIGAVSKDADTSGKIEILLTALSAFITAVIVIPVTITRYLFNQKEVEQFTALLQSVQQHNEKMILRKNDSQHSSEQVVVKQGQEEITQNNQNASPEDPVQAASS